MTASLQVPLLLTEQHGSTASSSSSRDSTRTRGLSPLKNAAVPFGAKLCHRHSSPSSISAAIITTTFPLKRSFAILKPVSYLHERQSRESRRAQAAQAEAGHALVNGGNGLQVKLAVRIV